MNDHEKKLAAYDLWANRRVIRSLDSLPVWDDRVSHLVSHLVAAKEIWLARIRGEETGSLERWPTLKMMDVAQRLGKADAELLSLCLQRADLKSPITYQSFKGEAFSTPLRDIILHMVNHASYHRGQIATAIKQAGGNPQATDYIVWCREMETTQGSGG